MAPLVYAGGAMSLNDLQLLDKLANLDIKSHNIVKNFNKSERHVLSAEIRQTLSTIHHLVIRAVKVQLKEKRRAAAPGSTLKLLEDADVEIEYLKHQIRKANALGQVDDQRYGEWVRDVRVVGGLCGGWIKSLQAAREKPTPKATPQSLL